MKGGLWGFWLGVGVQVDDRLGLARFRGRWPIELDCPAVRLGKYYYIPIQCNTTSPAATSVHRQTAFMNRHERGDAAILFVFESTPRSVPN